MTEKEFGELKPGDKVKIVSERPEKNWSIGMNKYLGQVLTIDRFCDFNENFVYMEKSNHYGWDRFMIDHKLTAEELAELDKKPDCDRTECCLNDEETEQYDEETEQSTPIKYFLFVEGGSIELDNIKNIERRNPEIKVVVYRQGARVPELKEVGECER